jgi:hypothetical protein
LIDGKQGERLSNSLLWPDMRVLGFVIRQINITDEV